MARGGCTGPTTGRSSCRTWNVGCSCCGFAARSYNSSCRKSALAVTRPAPGGLLHHDPQPADPHPVESLDDEPAAGRLDHVADLGSASQVAERVAPHRVVVLVVEL